MIRALLAGRKTQTRRVMRPQPQMIGEFANWFGGPHHALTASWSVAHPEADRLVQAVARCPYGQAGDVLWVKETWCQSPDGPVYKASEHERGMHQPGDRNVWKSSRFTPKALARIWLEVTAVRVERVQAITDADALAEGVEGPGLGVVLPGPFDAGRGGQLGYSVCGIGTFPTACWAFGCLWDSIHGPGAWERNEWIWALSFRRL